MKPCRAAAALLPGCGPGPRYAVIDPGQAPIISEQCSRPNPPRYQATWTPSPEQIRQLEADLPQLNALAPPDNGAHPGDADAYVRQYFGLVVNGQRLIYLNGFLEPMANKDWKQYAMVVCDGGASAWGAVYDPAGRRFSELRFNGSSPE